MDDRNNEKRRRYEEYYSGGGNTRERNFSRRDDDRQQQRGSSNGGGGYDRNRSEQSSRSSGYEQQRSGREGGGGDRYRSSGYEREGDRNRSSGYDREDQSRRTSDYNRNSSSSSQYGQSGDRGGGRGGFRGGYRGGFNGGRGNGSSGFNRGGGGNFHKGAGGDYGRMPESVENKQLLHQQMACGTEGTSVELISNFYQIMHSDIKVYHYDCEIVKVRLPREPRNSGEPSSPPDGIKRSPDSGLGCGGDSKKDQPQEGQPQELSDDRKMAQERFIKKFADKILDDFACAHPNLFEDAAHVYDGWKNVYTTKLLNFGTGHQITEKVDVNIDQKMATFKVTLKLVDRISMSEALEYYNGKAKSAISERIISVFEAILRYVMSKSYSSYQRKFFDLRQVERSPKAALVDFVQGFINSVRMTEFGLALNVHLKTSAIISKTYDRVISLVCEIARVSEVALEHGLEKHKLFEVNKILRHLKMVTRHGKRPIVYSIDGIVAKTPKEAIFEHKGKKTSIYEYFKNEYEIRLKPLPMVRATSKNVHIPLELCFLQESQFLNKTKFDINVQRELLFKSTHQPNVYFHKLANIVKRINESDTTQTLSKFGVNLNTSAARISGRVLKAPLNLNSNNRDRFYRAGPAPPSWAIFTFDTRGMNDDDLSRFQAMLVDTARKFGLHLPPPTAKVNVDVKDLKDVTNVLGNIAKKTNIEFLFIGIPSRHDYMQSSEIYSTVKQYCDQESGIMTQCFQTDKARQIPPGYFDTFLLKVNGKIEGLNSALDPNAFKCLPFNPAKTMIVGIDVSHPGEADLVVSSVAVAVGSYDPLFSRYNSSIRVQRQEREEMVTRLGEMISELLEQYKTQNKGNYPESVILFRDGVSDGALDKVLEEEVPRIRTAFKDIGCRGVKLTLIVVHKRHNVRFALTQQNMSARKPTYNVASGTVVDRGIVEPHLKVFYLNSHFSPLGTSKPTKYILLQDDHNLSSDNVQKLCFYSCYNSIRTRNVIAIPTAVRYAHLCAARSKMHLEAQRNRGESSRSSSSQESDGLDSDREEAIIRKLNKQAVLHERVRHRLFYC